METISGKTILFFLLTLAILTTTTLALAKPYRGKVCDARVNTHIENQFDGDHNGWLDRRERQQMRLAKVNTRLEMHCDLNHNGWLDTPFERRCHQ